jgi:epoxyqueuosine reductase
VGRAKTVIEPLIKAQAYGLGFDLVGITGLGPAETGAAFDAWIERGYEGEMQYMSRTAAKRRDSRLPFPAAKSAIVVGMDYGGREPAGPVARYARGDDYHDVLLDRLLTLHQWIERTVGVRIAGKAYVDTGPILERDLARRAGLGWFGKNSMLINPKRGSFFFLAELLLDLELEPDAPFATDHCGTCRRCLDACPTGAIVEEGVVDATRCISYLTIELKGEIPSQWHAAMREGGTLYGCDVCQDVCPWNEKFASPLREEAFSARSVIAGQDVRALALKVLAMDDERFRAAFKNSPMKRAKLHGLKRTAAILTGDRGGSHD